MEIHIHDIITYILSWFLPSINKDLQIQKNIYIQNNLDEIYLDEKFLNY
jgi:hypothetical protein